jgi:hypothetical protein
MTDEQVLREVLRLPEACANSRRLDTVLAFLSGYSLACEIRGKPTEWDQILEAVYTECTGMERCESSRTLYQGTLRNAEGDELKAFERFKKAIVRALDGRR